VRDVDGRYVDHRTPGTLCGDKLLDKWVFIEGRLKDRRGKQAFFEPRMLASFLEADTPRP
jgi:hypothetical protein